MSSVENTTGSLPGRDSSGVVVRETARVLVLDDTGRVLLLKCHDPALPDEPYWFTVGGGIDQGETAIEAACRELREETGLDAEPDQLEGPVHHDVAAFSFDRVRYEQSQHYFLFRVHPQCRILTEGREAIEHTTITHYRWWSAEELETTSETFYPLELPQLIRTHTPQT